MSKVEPIKIVIADDHRIYREGVKLTLLHEKSVRIVGEAGNGLELINLLNDVAVDVVLMDIMMPVMDGIEAVKLLKKIMPYIGVIALSMFDQDYLVIEMLEAGAMGYILKNAEKEEIIQSICMVFKNQPYYSQSISSKLIKLLGDNNFNLPVVVKTEFNDRELQVIRLICEELTSKEIAARLFSSKRTVEGYRKRIMAKLNVKSSSGIIVYALRNGLY